MEPAKKPWYSKTVWFNLAMAGLAFYPPALQWAQSHPEAVALFWSGLNLVLRWATKGKIQLS